MSLEGGREGGEGRGGEGRGGEGRRGGMNVIHILLTWSLGGYEFGLEIESVLGKFEKTIYNDISSTG